MSSFRMRPRFELEISRPADAIIDHFRNQLHQPGLPCRGLAVMDHVTIRVRKEELHFWSPQLNVTLFRSPDGLSTHVTGRYGPMPNVWTLFTGGYLLFGFLFMFVSIVGFSQYSLGQPCQILWFLPVLAILIALLYVSSQLGQKLGAEQMFTLHHFFEETIGQRVHIS